MTITITRALCRLGIGLLLSGGALALGGAAQAQDVPSAEAAAQRAASARLGDSDNLVALTADGAILYAQEDIKLTGYQYCNMAVTLAETGEFRQSIRAASKALHLANASNDETLKALAYRDLAIAYGWAGQLDKSIDFAREALSLQPKDPQIVHAPAHKLIGDARLRRGDATGAVLSYEEALAVSSPRYKPLVQASLVNALIEVGELARARALLAEIPAPTEPQLQAQLERTRARLLLAEQKPQEALEAYRNIIARSWGTDSAYVHLWAWDGVAQSAQALGQPQEAAAALDQALALIAQVRARFRSEEIKIGLFSDLQAVFERAIALHAAQGDHARAFDISERSRARALLDAVRGRGPVDEQASAVLNLPALQAQLQPDERVLQFHALPDHLQIWLIGPGSIEGHRLPIPRPELNELVEVFRNSVVRGQRAALGNADKLGQALIAPLGLAEGQRLIVVPHGPLHYLPFQALRVNGRYLVERHPISVAPSISIAMRLAERTPQAQGQLTAFGNPRIEDKYELPGAETEVRKLANLFPRHTLFVGEQATKTRFRQTAARAPILHVAAHAEADEVDPLYSRILLANEGGRHNFLEAHEILQMNMPETALVTLSACESGLGRVDRGDEVLGFTRSFLSAGSSSLIASLWPVSDDATAVLMDTLYAELAQGRTVQQALRAGQLAVLQNPEMAHPFFWAPFNLIGNWRLTLGS